MRPRLIASENIGGITSVQEAIAGFNEAEADRLGKPADDRLKEAFAQMLQ